MSWTLVRVGLLQGLLLALLLQSREHAFWQSSYWLFLCLLVLALVLPVIFYLSENTGMPGRRRAALVGVAAVLFGGLALYVHWLSLGLAGEKFRLVLGVPLVPAAMVLGFVLVPLVAAWQPQRISQPMGRFLRRWSYPLLFELAWRNGLLLASVAAIAGLFWAVLAAGAMLLGVIGLPFMGELLLKPWFSFSVTGMVVGAAFALGTARAELLLGLRRFWLALNAWLLPLLLLFGVVWVAALPFTGLQGLFGTKSAALLLLWFCALGVLCVNAAWQDGQERQPYPDGLATVLRWAWLSLVPIVLVAGWALALRIGQYGWSEHRIWAVFICILLCGYALGYAASVWPALARRGWMSSVGSTNVLMALVLVSGLVLLLSPLADPRRLAVADQVQRLQDGRIDPARFDFVYLRDRTGRWGQTALQALASVEGGDARMQTIARLARESLQERLAQLEEQAPPAPLTLEQLHARIELIGDTTPLDAALVQLIHDSNGKFRQPECRDPRVVCAAWRQDLDGDGAAEVLLVTDEPHWASAYLYARREGRWQAVAIYSASTNWLEALRNNAVQKGRPGWPELEVGNLRVRPEYTDP